MPHFAEMLRGVKLVYDIGDPGVWSNEHPSVQALRKIEDRLDAEELLNQCEIMDRLCYERRREWQRDETGDGEGSDVDGDEDQSVEDDALEEDDEQSGDEGDEGDEDDTQEGEANEN